MTQKEDTIVKLSRCFLIVRVAKYPKQNFFCCWGDSTRVSSIKPWRTLLTKVFVKVHSIKVCSMESLCPQYRHSSSFLIPNLSSSLFVTIILCMNLKWNSLSLFSLQTVFSDLKIFDQASSFNEILLLHQVGPE